MVEFRLSCWSVVDHDSDLEIRIVMWVFCVTIIVLEVMNKAVYFLTSTLSHDRTDLNTTKKSNCYGMYLNDIKWLERRSYHDASELFQNNTPLFGINGPGLQFWIPDSGFG